MLVTLSVQDSSVNKIVMVCLNVRKYIDFVAFSSPYHTNIISFPRRVKVALKTGQGTQTSQMPYFCPECLFAKADLQNNL